MIEVTINEIDFTSRVEIDLSFVEKLNRELDEGYISIPHTFKSTPFNMYDIVNILWDDNLVFSGRVSMDRVGVASFNDRLFNHEISLIEHTKILEKYFVKGKTFTRPLDSNYGSPYTLLDVIEILKDTTPIETLQNFIFFRPFSIPEETEDLTKNIISPEFNFKDLSLRQALDQVASVLDSIVRLDRGGNLFFTQFDKLKQKVEFVSNNYSMSQNINNYNTVIESEMLNSVMGANDILNESLEEVYPSKTGFTSLRSNGYLFGFENDSFIPTQRPIYRINDVVTVVDVSVTKKLLNQFEENILSENIEVSIGDRIIPFETWNTLPVDGGLVPPKETPLEFQPTKFFKNNTIYYKYGKKNIFVGETYGVFGIDSVLEPLIFASTMARLIEQGILPEGMDTSPFTDNEGTEWKLQDAIIPNAISQVESKGRLLTRVFYTPIPKALRFQIDRDTINEINIYSESSVNQQTRIIDVNKYGNNLKGKVNKMGNSTKKLSHRVSSPTEVFDIGDFILDDGLYVITQKEIIIHRNHTIVNYELTRNFNNFSQFMGVDKEIRQSEVGESNRTIERDIIYKEFVELETTKDTQKIAVNQLQTLFDKEPIIRTIDPNETHETMDFAVFSNENADDWFLASLNTISGGNTISFNFEPLNNITIGNQNKEESRLLLPDRSFNEPLPYADEQGRFKNLNFRVYKDGFFPQNTSDDDGYDQATDFANRLPLVKDDDLPNSSPIINGEWYVEKDNREILKFSILYSVLSQNLDKVVIGNRFSLLNGLVRNGNNNVQLWIYQNRRFDVSDSNKSLEAPDIAYNQNLQLSFNINDGRVTIQNNIPENYSWALVDDEGYPYLMSNTDDNIILFNFRNKRNNVKYSFHGPAKTEQIELVASSILNGLFDGGSGVFEFEEFTSSTNANPVIDFTTEFLPGVSLTSLSSINTIIDFTTSEPPGVSLSSTSISETTIDFTANPLQGIDLVSNTTSQGTLDITSNPIPGFKGVSNSVSLATIELVQEAPLEFISSTNASSTLDFSSSEAEKVWVSGTYSGPFDVTLDLGEVNSCPGISQARDELEEAFPAANQDLENIANVTSYRITNGFVDPCQSYQYKVETE